LNGYSQISSNIKTFAGTGTEPPRTGYRLAEMTRQAGLNCRRRTSLNSSSEAFSAGEVLLVDTVGEMMKLNSLSILHLSGQLVPTGGHNLLEPASMGSPVCLGRT
jgi:3-deoxy-D-manno-octulosonic-acid transferase